MKKYLLHSSRTANQQIAILLLKVQKRRNGRYFLMDKTA